MYQRMQHQVKNISFNHTKLKGITSTPKEKNDKDEKLDFKDKMLSCKQCNVHAKKTHSSLNMNLISVKSARKTTKLYTVT